LEDGLFKYIANAAILAVATATFAHAAQLSTEARGVIPNEVQQLVVIDYRAMQNSKAAMDLRERVMPPELKQFDEALRKSGLNENHDVDQLAFALFRASKSGSSDDLLTTVGIAQGQFPINDLMANFRKQGVKPTVVRNNKLYPLGRTGMVACFLDSATMVFGSTDAVGRVLDVRDGNARSMLTNSAMMDAMKSVDADPLWSILDQKGTQTMMKQVLGEAGAVADFDTVKKRLQATWYSLNFQHGVKFDLTLSTGDSFAAATLSSLMNAAVTLRKMSGSDAEKLALAATTIKSDSGHLSVHFATTDSDFNSLLHSPLFGAMVH